MANFTNCAWKADSSHRMPLIINLSINLSSTYIQNVTTQADVQKGYSSTTSTLETNAATHGGYSNNQ